MAFLQSQDTGLRDTLSFVLESQWADPGVRMKQAGTWDLGPFAAMLAPGQTSPSATKYKETLRD